MQYPFSTLNTSDCLPLEDDEEKLPCQDRIAIYDPISLWMMISTVLRYAI